MWTRIRAVLCWFFNPVHWSWKEMGAYTETKLKFSIKLRLLPSFKNITLDSSLFALASIPQYAGSQRSWRRRFVQIGIVYRVIIIMIIVVIISQDGWIKCSLIFSQNIPWCLAPRAVCDYSSNFRAEADDSHHWHCRPGTGMFRHANRRKATDKYKCPIMLLFWLSLDRKGKMETETNYLQVMFFGNLAIFAKTAWNFTLGSHFCWQCRRSREQQPDSCYSPDTSATVSPGRDVCGQQ